jgi:hypothetical protein
MKEAGGVTEVVEHLPRKQKALSSNSYITKKGREGGIKGG